MKMQNERRTHSCPLKQRAWIFVSALTVMLSSASAFSPSGCRSRVSTRLHEYRFGDISRGILGKATGDINRLTGKNEYEFGDLTKWLDNEAKARVSKYTSKESYEFGDLSRTVLTKVLEGEYTKEDLWIILKLIGVVGLQPVAPFLPAKVLTDLLEISVARSLGEKVVSGITNEVDQRMKAWLTGDRDYKFGDLTKKVITGDKSYQFGDITKRVLSSMNGDESPAEPQGSNTANFENPVASLDDENKLAFEEWDQKLVQSRTNKEQLSALEFKEWDERFMREG